MARGLFRLADRRTGGILAPIQAREDLDELALGGLTGDAFGLDVLSAEGFSEVVGVAHAGRVDHARDAVEAGLVKVRDSHVEGLLVEQFRELVLVELGVDLTAAERHLGDRAHAHTGRDAHAAQR